MASVPRVEAPTVSANGSPVIPPQAPAGAFGLGVAAEGLGEVGKALGVTSDDLAKHAEQFQMINNKNTSDAGFIQSVQQLNDYVEKFKANNMGVGAPGALPIAFKDMESMRAGIGEGMNPMAKAMYDADSRRIYANATSELSRFAATQFKEGTIKQAAAVSETLTSDTALHPENIGDNLKKLAEQQAVIGQQMGWTKEEAELNMRKAAGAMVATATQAMAGNGDITKAAAFLDAHKDVMDGQVYAHTLAALRPAMMANDAASAADQIVARAVAGAGSIGARNNNPLNLTTLPNGRQYAGQVGAEGKFAAFASPEAGRAAADQTLQAYGTQHGIHTLAGVINRWAPPSENDTQSYINTVSAATGIAPNANINLSDPAIRAKLLPAMERVETGGSYGRTQSVQSASGGPPTSYDLQAQMPGVLAAVDQQAEIDHPGNATYKEQMEQRAVAKMNRNIAAAKDAETNAYNTLGQAILNNHIEDQDTLLKTVPGGLQLWNTLPLQDRTALTADMKRDANEWNPIRGQNEDRITGLLTAAKHGDQGAVDQLRQENFTSDDVRSSFRISAMKELQVILNTPEKAQQDRTFKAITTSPNFKSAIANLGINMRTQEGKNEYYRILGGIQGSLDDFRAQNPGKPIGPDEMSQIQARVIAEQHYGNYFLGLRVGDAGTQLAFKDFTPEEIQAASDYLTKKGRAISSFDVGRLIVGRRLLQERANGGK